MKDYAIWAAEKIEKKTGLPWESCMNFVTADKALMAATVRSLFEDDGELSMSRYLKEASNEIK